MVRPAGLAVAGMILTVSTAFVDPRVAVAAVDASTPESELVPEHVAQVYDYAAATAPCAVSFATLAGVGAVTSDHTRVGGAPRLLPDGSSEPTIVYEQLVPTAPTGRLPDTDAGAIDGVTDADITVGPMQFLPATWLEYGVDGNGDGTIDPHNLWDAVASTANRLCVASVDTDLASALTAYFGTDIYHEWILESIEESSVWQANVRPAPQRRVVDVISIESSVTGATTPAADTVSPGTLLPETVVPETVSPETVSPGTVSPGTVSPGTVLPETVLPETVLPETVLPETVLPVTDPPPVDESTLDPTEEVSVAGIEQLPSSAPAPNLIGPPKPSPAAETAPVALGELSVLGDWDGDGAPGRASLVVEGDRTLIRRTDAIDRPYGHTIDVSDLLADTATVGGLVVGEWDGDGIDDLALLVSRPEGSTAIRFDRRGSVVDTIDLGLVAAGATVVVGPAPVAAALTLGDEAPWKTVTAADGTELDLWKVGGIIVEASMVEQTSAMLAAAAADGIVLQGWGWRSHDAQIELRRAHCADVWTTPASQCRPPTAVPGTSRHEFGTAIDFFVDTAAIGADSPEFAWLVEHAEEFGYFNLPSEPWHWSIDGG